MISVKIWTFLALGYIRADVRPMKSTYCHPVFLIAPTIIYSGLLVFGCCMVRRRSALRLSLLHPQLLLYCRVTGDIVPLSFSLFTCSHSIFYL